MRRLALRSLLFVAASGASSIGLVTTLAGCGGATATPDGGATADMAPLPAARPVCTPYLPKTAVASFSGDVGACTEATTALAHHDAADIVPDGYTALGSAQSFDGFGGPFPHGIDIVLPCDLSKGPSTAPANRIVVVGKRADGSPATIIPAVAIVYEKGYKRLHFRVPALGTFQAAIPKTAGTKVMRHFTYRALSGVSMGGVGSSMNFWRSPERYDAITVMGADPGPDLTYTLGVLQQWFFSGFCDAASGKLGQLCPSPRKALADQGEVAFDFEHMYYQPGEGVGLTLSRDTYTRAFRDLSRTLGNAAYPSDPANKAAHSTYLPPGVPASTIFQSNADACAHPTILSNYYDYRYNPDGALPVITFCDGSYSDALGKGTFDPSVPGTNPTQILLAVDVNKNGKRDTGEPVLIQGNEHYYDLGTDGLADADEPGYNASTNPDPSHDNYHYFWNPTGTENNWRYDKGEKFDDFGVDGVKGKGCAVGSAAPQGVGGCYDFGEGNGQYDTAPNLANWYAHDPRTLIESLPESALARLDTYYDAGIRDFLNAQVSTNSLTGALQARGHHVRVWEGFPALDDLPAVAENRFRITDLDFNDYGHHMYVRYGNPDLSESAVQDSGDGRHVGTISQVVQRGQTMFYFLNHVWPGGDTDVDVNPGRTLGSKVAPLTFTAKNGRVSHYSIWLPPGYDDDKNKALTYPVLYFGHGYGMSPDDLGSVGVIAQNGMVNGDVPPDRRLQKFILVFVDGVCRPGGDVRNGPLPMDGDLCEEGTFYADHADGTAQAESHWRELQDLIDKTYRVKPPADVEVTL